MCTCAASQVTDCRRASLRRLMLLKVLLCGAGAGAAAAAAAAPGVGWRGLVRGGLVLVYKILIMGGVGWYGVGWGA